jgi:small nuclear ribonucleoprotein (snRNP)-like protein
MDVFRNLRLFLLTIFLAALPAVADEIQLKDGKSFSGTIIAFDNNMFKVKTDFGYILIEKSKIASIIPGSADNAKTDAKAATKKPIRGDASKQDSASAASDATQPAGSAANTVAPGNTAAVTAVPVVEKTPIFTNTTVRPELPALITTKAVAPSIKAAPPAAASTALSASAVPLARPQGAVDPSVPEEVVGTAYTNHAYGFRMYKAPSWQLIEDATALPNAIVAMGTQNQSTLLVVGREKTRQNLDAAAATVEKRLREVYGNYQQTSHQKLNVGGLPAVEYRYRGTADGHEWSGTLAVMARNTDIFTVLGMTYADTDLIQIQENVIAKAIASLDFTAR